jgi:predicted  nucleic acid-binding Zn-ribbon protein
VADLEKRVSQLEHEVQALKSRLQNTDAKVAAVDEDLQGIPGLIKAEFRLIDSRFSRVMAEMAEFRTAIEQRLDERIDAVIRAVSEMIAERDRRS